MTSIFLTHLGRYNEGTKKHGEWIDVTGDETHSELIQKLAKKLNLSEDEFDGDDFEYAIHDYEGFESLELSEHESLCDVIDYANFINENSDADVILALKEEQGFDTIEEAVEFHENNYRGEFNDMEDMVYQDIEEGLWGEIPERLMPYLDTEKMARDTSYDYVEVILNGKTHIWFNH